MSAPEDDPSAQPPARVPETAAAPQLAALVYDELREMARVRMLHESPGHTLQATALVNEVYLRLGRDPAGRPVDRAQFFRVAAEAMRRILIEHARGKLRVKRTPGGRRLPLASVLDLVEAPDPGQVLLLDEAIERLEHEAPAAAQVVRQRFYAGLTIDETAEALGMSPRSVTREWTFARAWLFRELSDELADG